MGWIQPRSEPKRRYLHLFIHPITLVVLQFLRKTGRRRSPFLYGGSSPELGVRQLRLALLQWPTAAVGSSFDGVTPQISRLIEVSVVQ